MRRRAVRELAHRTRAIARIGSLESSGEARDHRASWRTDAAGFSFRAHTLSSLDTFGKFVLDIRFFSSIIYILYEGEALRPPVVTHHRGGVM
jgi:hypothetical protein